MTTFKLILMAMVTNEAPMAMLPLYAKSTRWRVVPMGHLRANKLRTMLASTQDQFDAVVAFRPSGWCFGRGGGAAGRPIKLSNNVTIVEVPYSEHSRTQKRSEGTHTTKSIRLT